MSDSDPRLLSLQRPVRGQARQSVVDRIRGAHLPLPEVRPSSGTCGFDVRSDGQPGEPADVALIRARSNHSAPPPRSDDRQRPVLATLSALNDDVVAVVTTKHGGGPFQEMPDHAEMRHPGPALFATRTISGESRNLPGSRPLGKGHCKASFTPLSAESKFLSNSIGLRNIDLHAPVSARYEPKSE